MAGLAVLLSLLGMAALPSSVSIRMRAEPVQKPESQEDAAAEETNRMFRLMDVQIDRFLTDVGEGRKEQRMVEEEGGSRSEAPLEQRTSAKAKALVRMISRNLKFVGEQVATYETASKERRAKEAQREAKLGRLEREVDELKATNTQEQEIEDLRAENAQLKTDKGSLVKTLQQLMGETQIGKLEKGMQSMTAAQKEAELTLEKGYKAKILELQKQLAKEQQTQTDLKQEIEEEKQRNEDAKTLVERAATSTAGMKDETEGLEKTLNQLQQANEGLVKEKGELMGTLRNLIMENSEFRRELSGKKRMRRHKSSA